MIVVGTVPRGRVIAIVGTRNPTREGAWLTRLVTRKVAELGFVIITGDARGVDSITAQQAVEAKAPLIIAKPCINSGVEPPSNGAIVGLRYCNGSVTGGMLVSRDWLIAKLADAIIVTEARSGSARLACCGTWYTVAFGVRRGVPVFILRPVVNEPSVLEAFRIITRDGAVPVGSVDELVGRLRGLAN
jgi:predicted Rossmann fold nucleotide-binding protein DprA/Smf involved in DNA uptake